MVSDKKMGIVVILVILASICLCSYHVINDNVMDDKPTYKIDTLDAGNITNETPITTVNLNINQEVGGCQIKFADTDTIYSINTTNTNNSNDSMNVTLKKGNYYLNIKSTYSVGLKLSAPVKGKMLKDIFESISSSITVTLKKDNVIIFSDISTNCGLEIVQE